MIETDRLQLDRLSKAVDLEIRELRRGEEEAWDTFVMSSPTGTFFHLLSWRRVIEQVLGHRHICLVAARNGKIAGVLPLARVQNRIFGDCLVSSPLAVYGGICADDEAAYTGLASAAAGIADGLRVRYLEFRNRTEPFLSSWPGRNLYVTFTQDLSSGKEKLLAGLPRDTRYAIRKGEKAGLEWVEDLGNDEFYEIYARSVHRLGTPVFPRDLFSALRSEFPGKVRLFGVRKEKKAVAGVLCFYFRDEVLPYYGGSLPEHVRDSVNNFMYWRLIAQSSTEGFTGFDFGRSKRGTGSFQFKSAWSMRVTELPYRYHLVRAQEIPHLSPVDKKFQLPVAAWKRLPFSWTKILGPRLIRCIPSI